jgi:hypothetical protein
MAQGESSGMRVALAVTSILAMVVMGLVWRSLDSVGAVRADVGAVERTLAGHDSEIEHLRETTEDLQGDMRYVRDATNRLLDRFGIDRPTDPSR